MFSFIANLKITFFYSTSRIFRKYNHPNGSLYNIMVHLTVPYVCKIVCQFFGMGSVCYWVCLFLGWGLCWYWVCVLGIGFVCLLGA